MRRRFMWRIAAFGGLFLFLVAVLAGLAVWFVATNFGQVSTVAGGLVAMFTMALIARGVIRGIRGTAAPAADLIEAAGRVEEGDFSARVAERGPREVRAVARSFNAMSARLEVGDRERRQLLADLSHELRTPLSVIRGNLEGILDGLYPADPAHLAPILEETHLLERLVEDLRTLSLSDAGALALHVEPTDLATLLDEVASGLQGAAAGNGVSLEVEADRALPPMQVDPQRIREVLTNLALNALRYTDRGGRITLGAAAAPGGVALDVADSGRGIDPEAMERIFDRFYRSPDSHGSGLGLAIARSLVEAHGGKISARSEPGRGTTIRVELPTGAP